MTVGRFVVVAIGVCRGMKVLENRSVTDEERIAQLQSELEAWVLLGEETDRKFEEVTSHRHIVVKT